MDAELFVERTFDKVRLPLWVEWLGILSDFYVAPDFGFACIHQTHLHRFAFRGALARLDRKRPSSIAQGWEAVLLDPIA